MDKITQKINFLENALSSLEIMKNKPVDPDRAQIDSCIQRFEYTFELCWKTIQLVFESKGQIINFPKDILKAAYKIKMINDEKIWLSMLADRNETSHVYSIESANKIYARIKVDYFPELQKTIFYLKNTFSQN